MNPQLNNKEISMNKAINVDKGDVLKLNTSKNGSRTYIAFKNGIKSNEILGRIKKYTICCSFIRCFFPK